MWHGINDMMKSIFRYREPVRRDLSVTDGQTIS